MEVRVGDKHVCTGYTDQKTFLSTDRHFWELPGDTGPLVKMNDTLGIAFFGADGNPISATAAKVDEIRIIADGNKNPLVRRLDDNDITPYRDKACIPIGKLNGLPSFIGDLKHHTLISVQVTTTASDRLRRYAERQNAWEAYGWNIANNGYIGIWFPVGLLGSNLKKTQEGFNFSALPVGVAFGGRAWVNDQFYLGLSAAINWSISSTEVTMTDPATMAEKKNTVTTAKAAGFGGFIDFGSYVYAGYMYQADFGETNASPGHTLIVGPGPGLLKLLADLATKK